MDSKMKEHKNAICALRNALLLIVIKYIIIYV